MKITKNQLRRIIKEELEDKASVQELESRSKILKGLEIAGIDPAKLKELPSSAKHLQALLDMINQAIDSTVAGKGIQAQKKTSRVTQGMV